MTSFNCKGCTKRYPGCHSGCEEYLDIKDKRDRELEAVKKARLEYKTAVNEEFRGIDRRRSRKKMLARY